MHIYKRYIAFFFALLFIASQTNHEFHKLFESHHHYSAHASIQQNSIDDIFNLSSQEPVTFNDFHDCFLCQQHETLKLYNTEDFKFEIKRKLINTYKDYTHIKPLLSSYLLKNTSLRAPPATC